MEETESSDINKAVKNVNNFLDKLISLLSTNCMEDIDDLEDQCFSLKAVLGDSEVQNLMLSKPEMIATLSNHANQLEKVYFILDSLFKAKEVRKDVFSPWSRLAFSLKKHRAIPIACCVLGSIRGSVAWGEFESCLLTSIKRVDGNSPPKKDFSAPESSDRRESDKKTVIGLLLRSSNVAGHVPVLTIFGPGGLGKSKLARAVLDDASVAEEFELRLWVNVGEKFDVKNIVEEVIECIVGSRTEDLPTETLKDLLEKLIFEKKFLLVLGDFMSEVNENWDELMECLKCGSDGSRMIVVTRKESVADRISPLTKYELRGLSLNESLSMWDLDVPEGVELVAVEKIRDRILTKCDKNPLEIELIGKVLRYRPSETELLPFMREVLGKLDDPIFQLETGDKKISPALPLSYSYLPPPLQKCFLYCGLFPKSENIDVRMLIHHWIAQEYIIRPGDEGDSQEEIGLEYFHCLVRRSFLKEGERDELGNVRSCRLDNAMHDLATVMGGLGYRMLRSSKDTSACIQTRHVSFLCHFNTKSTEKCSFNAKRLRTFLLPTQQILRSNEGRFIDSFSRDMFTKFKHLYVCDLHSSGIVKLPSCIENLKYLRHLDISENDEIRTLPNSITKLLYLQVLNVSGCEMLEELPKNIRKLVRLRHIYCHRCWNLKYMPCGIRELTELHTLSWFVVAEDSSLFAHIAGLEELGDLLNLRQIEIRNLKHLKRVKKECQKAKLIEKQHLQSLTLRWNHDEDDEDDVADVVDFDLVLQPNPNLKRLKVREYKGANFPIGFSVLKNLVHISIKNCGRCRRLPPLDHIVTLECLTIENLPCLVFIGYNEDNACNNVALFKSLKKLHLSNCPNLKGWLNAEDDSTALGVEHFPSLTSAEIKDCPNFKPEFPNAEEKPSSENASTEPVLKKRQAVKRTSAIVRDIFYRGQPGPYHQLKKTAKSPTKWKTSVTIQDVETFPEELLKNLSSFEKLHINKCPKLSSLPQPLQHCTTLQELEISGCPQLEARCGESAADWPLVAHIPYIQVNGQFIQWNGHFRSNYRSKPPFCVLHKKWTPEVQRSTHVPPPSAARRMMLSSEATRAAA